jgi:hypothetical protein
MTISIGQRDEDIEGVPRQRKEIVRFWAFTTESRHRDHSAHLRYSCQWNSRRLLGPWSRRFHLMEDAGILDGPP